MMIGARIRHGEAIQEMANEASRMKSARADRIPRSNNNGGVINFNDSPIGLRVVVHYHQSSTQRDYPHGMTSAASTGSWNPCGDDHESESRATFWKIFRTTAEKRTFRGLWIRHPAFLARSRLLARARSSLGGGVGAKCHQRPMTQRED
jgi:hypothetical protein